MLSYSYTSYTLIYSTLPDFGKRIAWASAPQSSAVAVSASTTTMNTNPHLANSSKTRAPSLYARGSDAPPAYDQLSIAPPLAEERPSQPSADEYDAAQEHSQPKGLRQKWKQLKQEDERRRAERTQTVSATEADRIRG